MRFRKFIKENKKRLFEFTGGLVWAVFMIIIFNPSPAQAAVGWITSVDITPTTAAAWVDADVSAYIPTGATGVILHINNTTAAYNIGFRKNGSTDNRINSIRADEHFWAAIGVDSNRILELYLGSTTYTTVYLVGYFTDEAVFFTNAVDKSLTVTSTWTDIDISADTGTDTAIGAIFEVVHIANGYRWYDFRKNSSTDNFSGGSNDVKSHNGVIVGVDANEICEAIIESTDVDFFLVGYVTKDMVFNTNATDMSLSTTGAWTDLTALPSGATGAFFNVPIGADAFGLRQNGSTENIVNTYPHAWAMVAADSNGLIEGYSTWGLVKFYMVGYTTSGSSGNSAPTVSSISDSPDPIGVGAELNFSVDWNDGDAGEMVKIHICKGSGIATSTQTCSDGSWADSEEVFTNQDPLSVVYITQESDKGSAHNYWAFVCDDSNACSDGTSGTFTVENQRPDAPISLLVEGMEVGNAINITDTTPEFSVIYKDSNDEGDVAIKYCIQVNSSGDFTGTDMWISDSDSCYSGTAIGSDVAESQRTPDFSYAGTTLNLDGTTYYWRAWLWDGEERSATSTVGWFKMADTSAGGGVRLKGGRLRGGIRLK